jgi:hypothetical protein
MKLTKIIKFKNPVIIGLIVSIFMASIGTLFSIFCTNNIGCLIYVFIPLFPGIVLGLTGIFSIFTSLIFWFVIGSLIGLLITKLKK